MADSYTIYTATGSQDTFSISFGYLDPDHVFVTVDNVAVTFTFPSGSQVQLDAMPTNGQKVKVYRVTPRTTRQVVWQNASNLTATDLNSSDLQLLYISQEAFDTVADALRKDSSGLYDANSLRIVNVASPSASTDAANKAYVDASTVDVVTDAEAARDDAIDAKTGAEAALAACLVVYDNFDDRYLGQKSSAPTLDNDGNTLVDGALYYNTVDNKMYVYDLGTTTWLAIETNIADGAITTAKIANLNVTTGKLAANAVDSTKLADGAVSTTAKMADGIVTYAKMASAAIASTADWAAGTASKLLAAANFLPALAAALGYNDYEESSEYTLAGTGTVNTWTHGKGVAPKKVDVVLRCKTTEAGWAVGDELIISPAMFNGSSNYSGYTVGWNSTAIYLVEGVEETIRNRSTGAALANVTAANWRFVIRAWF